MRVRPANRASRGRGSGICSSTQKGSTRTSTTACRRTAFSHHRGPPVGPITHLLGAEPEHPVALVLAGSLLATWPKLDAADARDGSWWPEAAVRDQPRQTPASPLNQPSDATTSRLLQPVERSHAAGSAETSRSLPGVDGPTLPLSDRSGHVGDQDVSAQIVEPSDALGATDSLAQRTLSRSASKHPDCRSRPGAGVHQRRPHRCRVGTPPAAAWSRARLLVRRPRGSLSQTAPFRVER
jgi:hypothetical protein